MRTRLLLAMGTVVLLMFDAMAQYSLSWQNSQPNVKKIGQLAADNQGNTIVTGNFSTAITFGNISMSYLNNFYGCYIAKMNSSGGWTWATKVNFVSYNAGGRSGIEITGVKTDASGNIYITGWFNGSIAFDNITLVESYPTPKKNSPNPLTSDIFIAKISSDGTFLWAKREGTQYWDRSNSIAVDAQGNTYITGQATRGSTTGTPNDLYLAKYNTSGLKLWERKFSSSDWFTGTDIKLDGENNIAVAGSYKGTATFSPGTSYTATNTCSYLAKFNNSDGSVLWANTATGHLNYAFSILTDNTNNIYMTGAYRITGISFGNLSLPVPSVGIWTDSENSYLVKYSSSGTPVWATQAINTSQYVGSMGGYSKLFPYPGGSIGLLTDAENGIHLKQFNPSSGEETGALLSEGFTYQNLTDYTGIAGFGGITTTADGFTLSLNASGSIGFGNLTVASPQLDMQVPDLFLIKYTTTSANPGIVSGNTSLCIGQTDTYTSNGESGGTWSSTNSAVATVNSASGLVTAIGPGQATIIYSVNGASNSRVVTVNPNPDPGVINGSSTVCKGGNTTFSSNGTPGGTWSSDNTSVASVDQNGVVTGVGTGVATISYSFTSYCSTVSTSKTITVTDPPAIISCPGNIVNNLNGPNKCSVSINTPNPSTGNNCIVSKLTWVMTGALNSSSPATGINYVGTKTFPVGVTTITYTLTNGAGSSTSCSFTVTVVNSKCSAARTPVTEANVLMENTDAVILYPNPASGNTVTIRNTKALGTVRIYDISGKLIYNRFIGDPQAVIDVQKFTPGIYYIKTEAGRPITFIKQ